MGTWLSEVSSREPCLSEHPTDVTELVSGARKREVTLEAISGVGCEPWFEPSEWRSVCEGPVSSANVARCISKVVRHRQLSGVERMLLTTDGSVTLLLEALTGGPIRIAVLAQNLASLSAELASEIERSPGTEATERLVAMCQGERVLCFGSSVLILDRFPATVASRLKNTNISLGRLIFQPRVGVKRQPVSIDVVQPPQALASVFPAGERLLVRHSRLVIRRETVGSLREWFSESSCVNFDSIV